MKYAGIMTFLLSIALIGCNCCATQSRPIYVPPQPVAYYTLRTVKVVMPDGFGSGVVLEPHVVVTAYHVVRGQGPIWVKRYNVFGGLVYESKAGVIKVDKKKDFALLSVEKSLGLSTVLAYDVPLGTAIVAAGYPFDQLTRSSNRVLFTHGIIASKLLGNYRFTADIWYGSSGGGVFDLRGRLVTVTQRGFDVASAYYGRKGLHFFVESWRAAGRPGL